MASMILVLFNLHVPCRPSAVSEKVLVLNEAYLVKTPDDNRRLYAKWAARSWIPFTAPHNRKPLDFSGDTNHNSLKDFGTRINTNDFRCVRTSI